MKESLKQCEYVCELGVIESFGTRKRVEEREKE